MLLSLQYGIYKEVWKLGGHTPLSKTVKELDVTSFTEAEEVLETMINRADEQGWKKEEYGPYARKDIRDMNHRVVSWDSEKSSDWT